MCNNHFLKLKIRGSIPVVGEVRNSFMSKQVMPFPALEVVESEIKRKQKQQLMFSWTKKKEPD